LHTFFLTTFEDWGTTTTPLLELSRYEFGTTHTGIKCSILVCSKSH